MIALVTGSELHFGREPPWHSSHDAVHVLRRASCYASRLRVADSDGQRLCCSTFDVASVDRLDVRTAPAILLY